MLSFKQFLYEMKRPKWEVTPAPGSTPIPAGHVRLYHQTSGSALSSIRRKGIESRQPVEGPRGIYADEKGFYGDPRDKESVEFSVSKNEYNRPFVHRDKVESDKIIATHKPWHETVRYIDHDPKLKDAVIRGEHDDVLQMKRTKEAKAIRFIKKREDAKGRK